MATLKAISSPGHPGKQEEGNKDTHADGEERQLLTVEQAAQYLQLSPSSIRSYIRQGKLKAFRIAGLRKVLIARAELLALLEPATPGDTQSGGAQSSRSAGLIPYLQNQTVASPSHLTREGNA